MIETKFRGKLITGEWIYGCLVVNPYEVTICDDSSVMYSRYEVIPETVGQWTGLKDKNGQDIYDGDHFEAAGQKAIIHYSVNHCCWMWGGGVFNIGLGKIGEVIGNEADQ